INAALNGMTYAPGNNISGVGNIAYTVTDGVHSVSGSFAVNSTPKADTPAFALQPLDTQPLLLFSATASSTTGTEPYLYNQSTGTATLLGDLNSGSSSSSPTTVMAVNGKILFLATANNPTDGNVGKELYVYDSLLGTSKLVADLNAGSNSSGAYGFTL